MNVNAVVLLCLLLTAVAISNQVLAQADACCFALTSRRISWRILKSYQISNDECPLKAVIFTTSRNMQICANPTQK